MSRGLRNRNPGNIRRSGVRYVGEKVPSGDPEFREFVAVEWGYRAMFVLLYTYRLRYGLQTVAGLIGRWAPPSENRTESYVRFVADRCGLKDDEPIDLLDPGTMIPLAAGLCASAAVAPLIAFRFGSVSFVGAAVNPFAALTAQAIVGGAVLWLCLPFEGLRPGVEGWLEGVVRFQNAAVEAVAGWEHAACELSLTAGQTAAIYLFFVVATLFGWSLERKKSVFLRP